MQERLKICKWRIAVWLLIVCCVQPTRAVSYKPTYVNTNGYNPAEYRSTLHIESVPEYQFQSTSIMAPATGTPKIDFVPLADGARPLNTGSGMRKGGWPGGDPSEGGGEEIGTVTEPPVGEPLVLLLFALAYLVIKRRGRRVNE